LNLQINQDALNAKGKKKKEHRKKDEKEKE
jgi:hypothetical protein